MAAALEETSASIRRLAALRRLGGFGSDHLGGIVVVMFGDGSVRYVSDVVDPQVLKLLGNRADGQLINLKDFER